MNKQEFLLQLRKGLSGLPRDEIEERLTFYGEMIDDRMEEGLSEEEAVSSIGSVNDIVAEILAEIPLARLVKEKVRPKRRLRGWEIVFLILGSPIWLSLLISFFVVIFSVYVSLWSVIISLWSVFVSLAGCAVGGAAVSAVLAIGGNVTAGIIMLAAGVVCAGFSIFMFFGCKAATTGILILTKKIAIWIKNCFIKKEEA